MAKRVYYAPANIRLEKYQQWMEEDKQEAMNKERGKEKL